MSKRLAITIAGAVSLGSYEAGVLYEVLDAIHQHNSNSGTKAEERIAIDVLTGASAGGMTAVILAHKLMFSAGEFRGPYDNPLYNTWVKRISLEELQQTAADEPALHSLFSSDLIVKISQECVTARYAMSPVPPAEKDSCVGDSIRVGVALTNLNGVDYGYPAAPDGKFVYTRFGDQMTRTVSAASDTEEFWEPLRQAAVACGAFPIAFRAQDLSRSAKAETEDYPAANLETWSSDPRTFTYSDGGILQNQPLGLAKNLVDEIDNHMDQENRFYLFVSPHAKGSDARDNFHEANADYIHLIQRLAKVVIGQSGFQDWITAEDMNANIQLLDARAAALKDAIKNAQIGTAALQATATSLLAILFPTGEQIAPGSRKTETLQEAQERIARQYREEIAQIGIATPEANAFRDAILAFETAAGLGARDAMRIYGVTADESELAGADLQAFLGFFDQALRDHDYDLGRTRAREVLTNPLLSRAGELGPVRFDATRNDIHPIDSRLNGYKLRQLPVADINAFKAGLEKRMNQMLKELIHNWVLASGAELAADPLLSIALNQVIARL